MVSSIDHCEKLFPEAGPQWRLDQLYRDLETIVGKPLKSHEKACLRGLLCRHRPGEIASACGWTSGSLRVELNKGLYRYIEALTENAPNSLRWEKVSEWLASYRQQGNSNPSLDRSIDWGTAPEIPLFFNRTQELQQLEQWLWQDRVRLVSIVGQGGIGKTALGVKLVERLASQFEVTIWRSLKNASPLTQLLKDTFDQAQTPISHLLELCKQKRLLLIWDDFETILQDGELVGNYRQGCQDYGELLGRIGTERHQSCLLILSREQPKEISQLEGENLPVRSYQLKGLSRQGAVALLQSKGFMGGEAGLQMMVEQYRGNPAALKLVAGTIREIFNGNVTEFLKQTGLALGDTLKTLLYQQFDRLSELEKDILYCLALKRRSIDLNELRASTPVSDSGSDLIDALESLRWRSLIEKNTDAGEVGFQLEPVVMKYVQRQFVEAVCDQLAQQPTPVLQLLRKHPLVEDNAPEAIRAVQIRLTLKPIKTRFQRLSKLLKIDEQELAREDYLEDNLALLGFY